MCGIVGLYNFASMPRDERADLCRMRDAMVHRGPDDAGVYLSADSRVALGHRRLSILDLSAAGRQPMGNEDGSVQITFNGEIYNYRDLVPGLLARGHRFHSKTDTEAIVHLYEDEGPECLRWLDGMFALGIWDASKRRLLLARDRLGKKPVYYTVTNGRLLFASEIKALLAYPGVTRDLDLEAVSLYLTFSNVPAPLTLFAGIRKLPAAHRLICDERGNLRIERYWSPLDGNGEWDGPVTEAEAVEQVRHLVDRAVAKRLISDVPIGALLSGGVDSSTNVAIMSRLSSEPLRTFSVGFQGFGEKENFHDLPYARRVAERFGCRHSELALVPKDCRDYLPEFVYQSDEPLGDPACLPMHYLCRHVKQQGVTVILVGEGSDEVFGGYGDMVHVARHSAPRWDRLRRLPRPVREVVYQVSRLGGSADGRVDLLRRAARNEPLYWGLDVVFWDTEKRRLFDRNYQAQTAHGAAATIQRYYDALRQARPKADLLQQMSFVELNNRLPELLLMRVDKLSMAHSLEARAPFLDYELVGYALSLPMRIKVAGGRTKHLLKEAVRPLLPADVIDRPKQGFRVPLPEWLAGELAPWAEHTLFSSSIHQRRLFNLDFVRGMWERHKSRAHDHSFDLWCLINLAAWYDRWIEGTAA
jgi:asparagine synthase (glutamine-hydrolysing)